MKKRIATLWVALFFAALTAIGLVTSAGYGQPLDGPSEQVILQENMKEYAYLLLGKNSAQVQGYDALGIQRITESIERDHGQAAYYLAAPLLQIRDSNPHLFNTLWHMYTWLWFMVGVISVYCICRSLGLSQVLACAAALLFFLSPRFFAEGHYNNKDVVLLSLALWTMAAGIRLADRPTLLRALLFGLAGALAANTRIIGFFVFGVMGIMAVVKLAARHELSKQVLLRGSTAIISFIVLYLLMTPAMVSHPLDFIRHVVRNATAFTRWTGVVIFKGAVFDPTGGLPLPRSYLPTMIALTVPVSVLLLSAVGGVYAVYLCTIKDERWPALLSLLVIFALPFLYAVLARPLLYNGWRHFYFLYGPMIVLEGLGLMFFKTLLQNSRMGKMAGTAALALVLCYQGIGIAGNHPYQYAYYNELAKDVPQNYELDYWEVSTLNAMEQLASSQDRDVSLPLTMGGGDPMSAFSLDQGAEMLPNDLRGVLTVTGEENPPYLFLNSTYAAIYSAAPDTNYRELFAVTSYGNVLCTVYERVE